METVVADSGKCPFSNAILTIFELIFQTADSGGLADKGAGLRALASWDFGFESRRGHGCVCLLWVVCAVRQRSLRRADHSSRRVTSSVICLSVIVEPSQWGDPGPLGLSIHGEMYSRQYDWQTYNFEHTYFVILTQQQTVICKELQSKYGFQVFAIIYRRNNMSAKLIYVYSLLLHKTACRCNQH